MLLGVDVLHRLRRGAQTAQSLASVLPASEADTKRVLDLLEGEGLVSGLPAGYVGDPSSFIAVYSITPAGEALYGRVLDRWAAELMGPPTTTVLERFLIALADDAPVSTREELFGVVADLPLERHDVTRRTHALAVARAAVGWAERALASDPRTAAAALGVKNFPLPESEEFGGIATHLRNTVIPKIHEHGHRSVVEAAAAAAEGAWELRLLGPASEGLRARHLSPSAYREVADNAAASLRALARALALDLVSETRSVVERIVAGQSAESRGGSLQERGA